MESTLLYWQPLADIAEAVKSAEKADPRVGLEWMCIRCDKDIDLQLSRLAGSILRLPHSLALISSNL
jgi:hypothetical protein